MLSQDERHVGWLVLVLRERRDLLAAESSTKERQSVLL